MTDIIVRESNLTLTQERILSAASKMPIRDMDDMELIPRAKKLFRFLAMDVGYAIPNETDWVYIQTRLVDILKRYYGGLTLEDIRLAFELAMVGKLDQWLPKNAHGAPDKSHYNRFNAEYFGKILNAYIQGRNEAQSVVYNALPYTSQTSEDEQKKILAQRDEENRRIYIEYKYTGRLNLGLMGDMFVYDWLVKMGEAEPIEITTSDRMKAYGDYMRRASSGLINQYTANNVKKEGIGSSDLDFNAYEIARTKTIKSIFDDMIRREVVC